MNYDPMRFCFECKTAQLRKEFRHLSRTPGKVKLVCAQCFLKYELLRTSPTPAAVTRNA